MRTVYATPGRALDIGRYPENNAVKVVFDVKCWRKQYPTGSIALLHQRPGDDGALPVAGLTVGDKNAEWLVSNADILYGGEGIATLILIVGEQVELSESWKTVIGEPVTEESETPPEPIESYMTAVIEAVESYDEMTAEAEDGDTADSEIDRTGDHPVLRLTLPRGRQGDPGDPGEPGDDGFSPVVTVTEITGGHRVTITDATGPHVFDVMDGQGGGGGDVQSVNGKTGVVVLNANDVGALPSSTPIPPAVTVDSELSNTSTNPVQNKVIAGALSSQSETIGNLSTAVSGKYAKPSGGIPSTDMSQAVQTSLGKADTAIQEHQDISGKQNKPAAAGTAGQVLGLDANLTPVWKNPFPMNYELVVDVTTEETLAAINILTDINNNPLNLSTMMMVITTPGYQNPTGAEGYLKSSYIDDNNQSHPFIIQTRIRSSNSVSMVWTERFGDYILTGATAAYDETEAWASSTNYYSRVMVKTDAIHGVSIEKYSSSSYDIPSGTRIQIYGVRA